MNRQTSLIVIAIAAISIMACLAAYQALEYPISKLFATLPTDDEVENLKAIAQPVVDAVLAFHMNNGRYPTDLAETHISQPMTNYGPVKYKKPPNYEDCRIVIGDYRTDHFALIWRSEARSWHMDQ